MVEGGEALLKMPGYAKATPQSETRGKPDPLFGQLSLTAYLWTQQYIDNFNRSIFVDECIELYIQYMTFLTGLQIGITRLLNGSLIITHKSQSEHHLNHHLYI